MAALTIHRTFRIIPDKRFSRTFTNNSDRILRHRFVHVKQEIYTDNISFKCLVALEQRCLSFEILNGNELVFYDLRFFFFSVCKQLFGEKHAEMVKFLTDGSGGQFRLVGILRRSFVFSLLVIFQTIRKNKNIFTITVSLGFHFGFFFFFCTSEKNNFRDLKLLPNYFVNTLQARCEFQNILAFFELSKIPFRNNQVFFCFVRINILYFFFYYQRFIVRSQTLLQIRMIYYLQNFPPTTMTHP